MNTKYFMGVEFEDFEDGETILDNRPKRKKWKPKVLDIILVVCFVIWLVILVQVATTDVYSRKHSISSNLSDKNAYLIYFIPPKPKVVKTVDKVANNGGYELVVESVSKEVGIDYKIPLAIIKYETGHFKSNAFMNYNNPGGIMTWNNGKRSLRRFESKEAGIRYMVNLLKSNYIDKGLDTFAKIQPKYAPTSDGNSYWLSSVRSIYEKL